MTWRALFIQSQMIPVLAPYENGNTRGSMSSEGADVNMVGRRLASTHNAGARAKLLWVTYRKSGASSWLMMHYDLALPPERIKIKREALKVNCMSCDSCYQQIKMQVAIERILTSHRRHVLCMS